MPSGGRPYNKDEKKLAETNKYLRSKGHDRPMADSIKEQSKKNRSEFDEMILQTGSNTNLRKVLSRKDAKFFLK